MKSNIRIYTFKMKSLIIALIILLLCVAAVVLATSMIKKGANEKKENSYEMTDPGLQGFQRDYSSVLALSPIIR